MGMQTFRFTTDTATLCVFDPAALRHRLQDPPDWWTWPVEEQVRELNAGHAAFLGLGRDGVHTGALATEPLDLWPFQVFLTCPSGQVFLGAGEEATSDGLEPDCTRGGLMLQFPQGTLQLRARMSPGRTLELSLCPGQGHARNAFTEPLRLSPSPA